MSVGIVTRNRSSLLRKALKSVLTQDYPDIEINVIDDASDDDTVRMSTQFPTVKWQRWPQSRGYMAGRNQLMSETTAEYYVSLDDDAWFISGDEIRIAVDYLDRHSDVAAIGFDILSPDSPQPRQRGTPRTIAMFIGCGHTVRGTPVRELGGYVSSPGAYGGEEKDLALRLWDAGYRIMSLPGVHVWHDKTAVARAQPDQHRSGVANDLAMTLRRTPLVALPVALITKLYKHLRFAQKHQLERPFREGVALFLKSVPELWQTRRAVRLATLQKYVQLSHEC